MEYSRPEPESDVQVMLVLWDRLSALLGTATTSALLRRALTRLSPLGPALAAVRVEREGLSMVCRVEDPPPGPHTRELATLGASLSAILRELTGSVVLRYLADDPRLAAFGFAKETA